MVSPLLIKFLGASQDSVPTLGSVINRSVQVGKFAWTIIKETTKAADLADSESMSTFKLAQEALGASSPPRPAQGAKHIIREVHINAGGYLTAKGKWNSFQRNLRVDERKLLRDHLLSRKKDPKKFRADFDFSIPLYIYVERVMGDDGSPHIGKLIIGGGGGQLIKPRTVELVISFDLQALYRADSDLDNLVPGIKVLINLEISAAYSGKSMTLLELLVWGDGQIDASEVLAQTSYEQLAKLSSDDPRPSRESQLDVPSLLDEIDQATRDKVINHFAQLHTWITARGGSIEGYDDVIGYLQGVPGGTSSPGKGKQKELDDARLEETEAGQIARQLIEGRPRSAIKLELAKAKGLEIIDLIDDVYEKEGQTDFPHVINRLQTTIQRTQDQKNLEEARKNRGFFSWGKLTPPPRTLPPTISPELEELIRKMLLAGASTAEAGEISRAEMLAEVHRNAFNLYLSMEGEREIRTKARQWAAEQAQAILTTEPVDHTYQKPSRATRVLRRMKFWQRG